MYIFRFFTGTLASSHFATVHGTLRTVTNNWIANFNSEQKIVYSLLLYQYLMTYHRKRHERYWRRTLTAWNRSTVESNRRDERFITDESGKFILLYYIYYFCKLFSSKYTRKSYHLVICLVTIHETNALTT